MLHMLQEIFFSDVEYHEFNKQASVLFSVTCTVRSVHIIYVCHSIFIYFIVMNYLTIFHSDDGVA